MKVLEDSYTDEESCRNYASNDSDAVEVGKDRSEGLENLLHYLAIVHAHLKSVKK